MIAESEAERVRQRYERRQVRSTRADYDPLLPHSLCFRQEKERELVRLFRGLDKVLGSLSTLKILEVGCGDGANLLQFLSLGCQPGNLVGVELLGHRSNEARRRLPTETLILTGDAVEVDLESGSFDICYQSTVFTSLLDDEFQSSLAQKMWALVRPGGGILWYDFTYDNPHNSDVRGVPIGRIRQLFPSGQATFRRLTLAPPIARRVARVHPVLYSALNLIPMLRTHVLGWISKSA